MNPHHATGIVTFYSDAKGYGFIDTEHHKDVFVHFTGIIKRKGHSFQLLVEGQLVACELFQKVKDELHDGEYIATPQGWEAREVIVIDSRSTKGNAEYYEEHA